MVLLYVTLVGVRRRQQWCAVCWGSHYFLTMITYNMTTLLRYPISFATADSVFGSVPINGFLGWVRCTGSEESLLDCEYKRSKWCNKDRGSGVICQGRAG